MLKPAATWVAILSIALLTAAGSSSAACNWGGRWDSNWGMLALRQQGDKVDGAYQGGRIVIAEVEADSITGQWERADGNSGGWFRFTMSKDCNSFKGKWGWAPQRTDPQATGWNGKRIQPIKLLPPSDKPQKLGKSSGGGGEAAVASIRGYAVNYADGSLLCFASDYPVMEAAFDETGCRPSGPGLAAVWRGHHYVKDWLLYLEVRDLKAPAPPRERIGIGYTVTLKNARFTDGKKTKTIVVYQFQGIPNKRYIKVTVPISSE